MCGNAAKANDVDKLMNGNQADMVFTDPPYNVNYSGRGKETSNTIQNDNMSEEDFRETLSQWFCGYKSIIKKTGALYVCYSSSHHREFEDALNINGFIVRSQIIWVKTQASMGWGDYRWKHEPILYCKQGKNSLDFYGDRSQYTVWNDEPTDEQILKSAKKLIEKDESGQSTVWRMSRDSNYKHPTQKPVELVSNGIRNNSMRGQIVADFFGGGGTTLIASEKLSRKCYMMEIDPKYIDVIIKRWEVLTGKKAIGEIGRAHV